MIAYVKAFLFVASLFSSYPYISMMGGEVDGETIEAFTGAKVETGKVVLESEEEFDISFSVFLPGVSFAYEVLPSEEGGDDVSFTWKIFRTYVAQYAAWVSIPLPFDDATDIYVIGASFVIPPSEKL